MGKKDCEQGLEGRVDSLFTVRVESDVYGIAHELIRIAGLVASGVKITGIGRNVKGRSGDAFKYLAWVRESVSEDGSSANYVRRIVDGEIDADAWAAGTVIEVKSLMFGGREGFVKQLDRLMLSGSGERIQIDFTDPAQTQAISFMNQLNKAAAGVQDGSVKSYELHITSQTPLSAELLDMIRQIIPNVKIFVYKDLSTHPSEVVEIPSYKWERVGEDGQYRLADHESQLLALEHSSVAGLGDRETFDLFFGDGVASDLIDGLTNGPFKRIVPTKGAEMAGRLERIVKVIGVLLPHSKLLRAEVDYLGQSISIVKRPPQSKDHARPYIERVANVLRRLEKLEALSSTWARASNVHFTWLKLARVMINENAEFSLPFIDDESVVERMKESVATGADVAISSFIQQLETYIASANEELSSHASGSDAGNEPVRADLAGFLFADRIGNRREYLEYLSLLLSDAPSLEVPSGELDGYLKATDILHEDARQLIWDLVSPGDKEISILTRHSDSMAVALDTMSSVNRKLMEIESFRRQMRDLISQDVLGEELSLLYRKLNLLDPSDLGLTARLASVNGKLDLIIQRLPTIRQEVGTRIDYLKSVFAGMFVRKFIKQVIPVGKRTEVIELFSRYAAYRVGKWLDLEMFLDEDIEIDSPVVIAFNALFGEWWNANKDQFTSSANVQDPSTAPEPWSTISDSVAVKELQRRLTAVEGLEKCRGYADWNVTSSPNVRKFHVRTMFLQMMREVELMRGKKGAAELKEDIRLFMERATVSGQNAPFSLSSFRSELLVLQKRFMDLEGQK